MFLLLLLFLINLIVLNKSAVQYVEEFGFEIYKQTNQRCVYFANVCVDFNLIQNTIRVCISW